MVLALRAARVLTSSSAELLEDGVVVVDGEKITHVGTWPELKDILPGIAVKNLGDVTLMPGLFDCHVGFPYGSTGE
jgi:imidazolonepropionase-like amidohydrolase